MGGSVHDTKGKIPAILSQKKQGHDKFGKTTKKLPELSVGHLEGNAKGRNIGFSSDSADE